MMSSIKRFALRKAALVFCLILTLAVLAPTAFGQRDIPTLAGGPPTITVTSLTGAPCGTECFGVKVDWTATAPSGTKITGYSVTVTPPSPCTGCFSPITPKTAPGGGSGSTVVGITSAGTLPPGNYTATVTATYTSSAQGKKSQTL